MKNELAMNLNNEKHAHTNPPWNKRTKTQINVILLMIIPQLTDCFRKLNIGGAACLLDKILLKKRTLDFST